MTVLDFTRRNYKPVNKCIYCGKDGSVARLTREHIVPYALGGKTTLPKASCVGCNKITQEFERTVARTNFGNFRIVHDYQTRNPQQRPTKLPINLIIGETTERREISTDDFPEIGFTFSWARPGILRNVAPEPGFPDIQMHFVGPALPDHAKRMERLGIWDGKTLSLPIKFEFEPFARMLAKIGHALAVAEYGMDSFISLLPDLILGHSNHLSYLVGGSPWPIAGPIKGDPFWVQIGYWKNSKGSLFIAVQIQLFRHLNMPTYMVVVGKPKADLKQQLLGHPAPTTSR